MHCFFCLFRGVFFLITAGFTISLTIRLAGLAPPSTHATTTAVHHLCLLAVAAGGAVAAAAPACVGVRGTPVAWWAALTLPHGTNYTYSDSDGARFDDGVRVGLASGGAPLAATLAPLYAPALRRGAAAGAAFAMWNDAPPRSSPSATGAHSKGVLAVAVDARGGAAGFWLSHSVPRWPPVDAYAGPAPPQQVHAQHFLCVSLNTARINTLASLLAAAVAPRVYSASLPPTVAAALPALAPIAGSAPWPPPPDTGKACMAVDAHLSACATSGDPPHDVWTATAAHVASPLLVSTWPEAGRLNASCGADGVVLDVVEAVWGGTHVRRGASHGKWGAGRAVLCGGDTNRAAPQTRRAGMTVCVHGVDGAAASARRAVRVVDACGVGPGRGV